MRKPEKRIVENRAVLNEKYQEAMKEAHRAVQCPYESERHKEAREYLKRRKIKVKALRKNND